MKEGLNFDDKEEQAEEFIHKIIIQKKKIYHKFLVEVLFMASRGNNKKIEDFSEKSKPGCPMGGAYDIAYKILSITDKQNFPTYEMPLCD